MFLFVRGSLRPHLYGGHRWLEAKRTEVTELQNRGDWSPCDKSCKSEELGERGPCMSFQRSQSTV